MYKNFYLSKSSSEIKQGKIFIIFNVANSYIFVGIYGIYHIQRKGSAYSLTDAYNSSLKELYFVDTVILFSKI